VVTTKRYAAEREREIERICGLVSLSLSLSLRPSLQTYLSLPLCPSPSLPPSLTLRAHKHTQVNMTIFPPLLPLTDETLNPSFLALPHFLSFLAFSFFAKSRPLGVGEREVL
jgi:hypothetical protein